MNCDGSLKIQCEKGKIIIFIAKIDFCTSLVQQNRFEDLKETKCCLCLDI
jgi:hypothetical protein